MTIVIRPMNVADAAAVAALTSELGYPSTAAEVRRRFAAVEPRENSRVFVAENQARAVVGWIHVEATCMLEADSRGEIWGLVVAEGARGRGVGRLLVEAAERWASARGLAGMGVRSNQIRTEAHRFYEHLGYALIKTQHVYRKALE